jgi:HEAT repeat protein
MNTLDHNRLLLVGIAVTALVALGLSATLRSRVSVETPADLARQAITAASPKEQAQAATRLAALAAQPRPHGRSHGRPNGGSQARPTGNEDVIASLQDTLANGRTSEVRAAAIVGLARTADRSVLPLLVEAIEDDDPLVSGRAVAAVQHLLGVRYEVGDQPLGREDRRRLAGMARSDTAALDGPGRVWWEAHTVPGGTW